MLKRAFCLAAVVLAAAFFAFTARAEMSNQQKFKHADRNKDGSVDNREMHMERNWERKRDSQVNTSCERKADANNDGVLSPAEKVRANSKVNTEAEKKYDTNGDGWLDATEGREYLKDKYAVIQTNGKAKVDSAIEQQYDVNKDGVIDAGEAGALKAALEE